MARIANKMGVKGLGLTLAALGASCGIGGLAVPVLAQSVAPSPTQVLQINTGRGRLVTLDSPISGVFVANDQIADVQVRSPTQIYIFAKGPGETTVYANNKAGRTVYATTVRVGNNLDSIDALLRVAMPDAQIVATPMNGLVLLTGTVKSPADVAEAERLVQAFTGKDTQIVSRLQTATPLQVNLQVRIAEVNRTFAKNVSSNLTTLDGTGGFKFGIGSGRAPASFYTTDPNLPLGIGNTVQGYTIDPVTGLVTLKPGTTITPGPQRTTLAGLGKLFGLNILGALDLGERVGQVTTLAQPNLTALSGETATFLAGGEIPIPVPQAGSGTSNLITIEYKQYGVSLAFTPTVLSDGRISIRVRPEVSEISSAGAVQISGITIPALTTRRVETSVELGSGESFMIAGLLSNNHNNVIDKTPGAGDIPVLGALFRSNAFQRNETELVVVITPYLVKPVNGNQIALPTDGYKSPDDIQRLLLGQLGSGTTGGDRPKPRMETPPGNVPTVGSITPVPALPGQPAPLQPARADKFKALPQDKKKKEVASAAPGFGL
jgi:pilus assembly protein CpaC